MKSVTLGKCEPCGIVYSWPCAKSEPLRGATCRECGRDLARTTWEVCRRLRVEQVERPARELTAAIV